MRWEFSLGCSAHLRSLRNLAYYSPNSHPALHPLIVVVGAPITKTTDNMTKEFDTLNSAELWEIRKSIVLNSIYLADYAVDGYNTKDIAYFFDGYVEYLGEMSEEYGNDWDTYDNEENLWRWYNCYEDLSWVRTEDNNLNDNDMKKYNYTDLAEILSICQAYLENTDDESILDYFNEFVESSLFHDAIGKIAQREDTMSVIVTTEY